MLIRLKPKIFFAHPKNYSLLLAFAWTVVIAVSLLASITVYRQEIVTLAQNVARAYIDKDILYRSWNAFHGGIYIVADKGVSPNPYLPPTLPERDVITPSGRHLTLVNPAYMTRQIYELAQKEHKIAGRITSLKPIRPENRADDWETDALHRFERGEKEVSGEVFEGAVPFMRLMRPLITEENCLTCHVHQGYTKGDIRGGISIKLPMSLFAPTLQKELKLLCTGHGVMWLLGLGGLYFGYTGLRRRTEERDQATDELLRLNVVLENQATTDALTGICNRRKFLESLQVKIQEANRYSMPLALIFFDIDHFKSINDTFGHETGDNVLRELSSIVTGMIRQTDIFARFGGEEFVILVHNNDVRTGRGLAEKIRSGVEQHSFPQIRTVTCSFGVAQFYPDDTAETFIKRADDAMYAAKLAGRNRVETRCDCQAANEKAC
ncbi:MAG: diguanylate cyclase [Desulforhabdus sp.]|nr:diguanylate cyclase [Desulforhabdus sp.]